MKPFFHCNVVTQNSYPLIKHPFHCSLLLYTCICYNYCPMFNGPPIRATFSSPQYGSVLFSPCMYLRTGPGFLSVPLAPEGSTKGQSEAAWGPLHPEHMCLYLQFRKWQRFSLNRRQIPIDRWLRPVSLLPLLEIRATTADSTAFILLAMSGSSSAVSVQSSVLCAALMQVSHLGTFFAFPVKHSVYNLSSTTRCVPWSPPVAYMPHRMSPRLNRHILGWP